MTGPPVAASLQLAPRCVLPLDSVTRAWAFLGVRGVGKTHNAAVLGEEIIGAGVPFAAIDPVGAWFGLRTNRDGQSAGLDVVILGGDHGDVPLAEESGAVLADWLVADRQHAVFDLSGLRKKGAARWVRDFCARLYHRNREAMHLAIDEAYLFAPQTGGDADMLDALEDVVLRGRGHGLGCTLIAQRAAMINKNLLTQCEVLVAMRQVHPRDHKTLAEWIELHSDPEQQQLVLGSLAKLERGEAWLLTPPPYQDLIRVRFRKRMTFDSSRTPEPGERRIEPRGRAEVDLRALTERVQATIERVKAEDPRALRQQIAGLQQQLAARQIPMPPPLPSAEDMRAVVSVIDDVFRHVSEAVAALRQAHQERMAELQTVIGQQAGRVPAALSKIAIGARVAPSLILPPLPPRHGMPQVRRQVDAARAQADVQLTPSALRVLEGIAAFWPGTMTRAQAAIASNMTRTGGAFVGHWSALVRAGYIAEQSAGQWVATELGRAQCASGVESVPTDAAQRLAWMRAKLAERERQALDVIVSERGPVAKLLIADRLGMTASGGAFVAVLTRLQASGLVEGSGRSGYSLRPEYRRGWNT